MTNSLVLHKNAFYFSIFAIFTFISTSTGFDFYSHSISYYFYEQKINYTDILFFNIEQPRYLLLSIIYESFSRLGIPLGYVALFMLTYPTYNIVKSIKPYKDSNGYIKYNLYQSMIIFFLIFSSFFYSGLSLALLWLFAAVISKKSIFLLGGLLHPAGILLAIVLFLFLSRKMLFKYLFLLISFYLFLYVSNIFGWFTSFGYENIRFDSDNLDIWNLFIKVIERKKNEIFQLFILSILVYFGFRKANKRNIFSSLMSYTVGLGNRIYIREVFIQITIVFITVCLYIYMFQKQTLISDIYTFEISNPVYVSWFDFGEKDLKGVDYWTLYCERYWDGSGCE